MHHQERRPFVEKRRAGALYYSGMQPSTEKVLKFVVVGLAFVAVALGLLAGWIRQQRGEAVSHSGAYRAPSRPGGNGRVPRPLKESPVPTRPAGVPTIPLGDPDPGRGPATSQPTPPPGGSTQPAPGGEQAAAPPAAEAELPIPNGAHGGPYEPWPVSFPKLLPGFFMLEEQAPTLRLSREQAAALLPIIDEMGTQWKTVHAVEIKTRQQLNPAQKAWITRVKHSVETTDTIRPLMAVAGKLAPGENASVKVALDICRKRMPKPVPAEVQQAADDERARELAPKEYEQKPGEEWLTVFDETNALFEIDRQHPDLALSPQQAVTIAAILQDVVQPLKVVSMNEAKIRHHLKPDQIKYVQDHMFDLYKYRTGQIKPKGTDGLAFPGNPANTDAHKYHDPLYYETVRFLKARVSAAGS